MSNVPVIADPSPVSVTVKLAVSPGPTSLTTDGELPNVRPAGSVVVVKPTSTGSVTDVAIAFAMAVARSDEDTDVLKTSGVSVESTAPVSLASEDNKTLGSNVGPVAVVGAAAGPMPRTRIPSPFSALMVAWTGAEPDGATAPRTVLLGRGLRIAHEPEAIEARRRGARREVLDRLRATGSGDRRRDRLPCRERRDGRDVRREQNQVESIAPPSCTSESAGGRGHVGRERRDVPRRAGIRLGGRIAGGSASRSGCVAVPIEPGPRRHLIERLDVGLRAVPTKTGSLPGQRVGDQRVARGGATRRRCGDDRLVQRERPGLFDVEGEVRSLVLRSPRSDRPRTRTRRLGTLPSSSVTSPLKMSATVGTKPAKLPVSSNRRNTSALSTTPPGGKVILIGKSSLPPLQIDDPAPTSMLGGLIVCASAAGPRIINAASTAAPIATRRRLIFSPLPLSCGFAIVAMRPLPALPTGSPRWPHTPQTARPRSSP